MVERRAWMNGAQDARMQLRLQSRFHGVCDHQIGFALDQCIEDRGVVAPSDDRHFL
jgi:hypothetical protein